MPVDSFDVLTERMMAASVSGDWNSAVAEWRVVSLEEDPTGGGVCVCGQTGLVQLFTIENTLNGETLYPIGSSCVNLFGREDLNRQVSLYSDLLKLRIAVEDGKPITLTTEFFSRAMLEYFFEFGAFTPDEWNHGDGEEDLEFLLKMFNKRKKEDINPRMRAKIRLLIRNKIEAFVLTDPRLKPASESDSN